ncbi:hypothetical protein ScPMuIL_018202 [Solemya velum]
MKHNDMELNRIFMEISRSLKSPNTENESEELKIVRTEILEFLTQGDIKNDLSKIGRGKRQTSGSRSGEIDDMITDVSSIKLQNYCRSVYDYCAGQNHGTPGLPGAKGEQGQKGADGNPGKKGDKGVPGPPGSTGAHGVLGLKGQKGEPGISGPPGSPGNKGRSGTTGTAGPPGIPGKESTSGVPGKPGPKGQKGEEGPQGLLGFPGFKGDIGPMGPKGDRGLPGNTGMKGEAGPMGPQGPSGKTGLKGDVGRRGRKGETGAAGTPGRGGSDGIPGVPGLKGEKGDRGMVLSSSHGFNCSCYIERGPPGPRGPPGVKGEKGQAGEKGCCLEETTELTTEATTLETTTETTTLMTTTTTIPTTTPVPTLSPRQRVCQLKMVGIPLFERRKGPKVGTWLRDPLNNDKIWVTEGWYGTSINEYSSLQAFMENRHERTHLLGPNAYQGTNHAMFNGSLYYHRAGQHVVVRYDLKRADVVSFHNMRGSNYDNFRYLYATGESYYDISIDENGLWVIYARENSNSILSVKKLDLFTMQVLKTWEIQVDHRSFGNGFVICGVLYLDPRGIGTLHVIQDPRGIGTLHVIQDPRGIGTLHDIQDPRGIGTLHDIQDPICPELACN